MPEPRIIKEKVIAYLTRERDRNRELLVFDHLDAPEAGTQVPAGSIDPGESPAAAVLRELCEEAGVCRAAIVRLLGTFPWDHPDRTLHRRHVFHLTCPDPLPDQWLQIVSAGGEDAGMRFRCYWIPLSDAGHSLSGDQGLYAQYL